ncbi:hypothetical protein KCH_57590 [Kitasatospora cheerisanensis KCTC 2395]|uniref:SCP2 domain-containing protein n=1 Tax=Kitasatospora cheerisanensis KCTC 2395 TaxID=1348663 RepID=A0A066YWJ0_9ACTN|nr:hypothetical protein KCH_57590 [Kitasatospora cheerisanensis KCTC 2395]
MTRSTPAVTACSASDRNCSSSDGSSPVRLRNSSAAPATRRLASSASSAATTTTPRTASRSIRNASSAGTDCPHPTLPRPTPARTRPHRPAARSAPAPTRPPQPPGALAWNAEPTTETGARRTHGHHRGVPQRTGAAQPQPRRRERRRPQGRRPRPVAQLPPHRPRPDLHRTPRRRAAHRHHRHPRRPAAKADIRLTTTGDDLVALVDGRLPFPTAWATGRLKLDASFLDLLRLRSLL